MYGETFIPGLLLTGISAYLLLQILADFTEGSSVSNP